MESNNTSPAPSAVPRHAALPIYCGTLRPQAARITSIEHHDLTGEVKLRLDTPGGSIDFLQPRDWFERSTLIAQGVHGAPQLVGGYMVCYEDGTSGWWSASKFEASFVAANDGATAGAPVPPAPPSQTALADQLHAMIEEEERNPALSCEENRQMLALVDSVRKRLFGRDAKREARVASG